MAIETLILTTETKADVAQKQSWISVSVVVTGGSGTISGGAVSLKGPTESAYTQIGTMNGVSVSADTATTVFSYSGVVAHQDTGGGTVSIQTAAYTLGGVSVASKTATYTLQQIPIPNTLTFGTLTAGTNAIFTITRAKTTYNSTITATANGQTLSILSNSTRSATVYTFAKSLFNDGVYMARKEMPITISIKTTDTANNNMVIGTRRYNTTLYFPDSPPVLSNITFTYAYASNPPGQSYINAETLTGKFYNNGLTNLQISGSVTPDNSRIKTITLDGDFGSHLLYDSSTAPPVGGDGTININTVVERLYGNNGSNTATLRVTDLRGAVNTATTTQTFYVAQAPTLSNASLTRGTYSGGTFTVDDEGTAVRYTATLSSETTFGILSFYNAGQYIGESQYATGSVTYYFTGVDPTVNTELRVDVHNWLSQASYIYIAPISKPDFNYNPTLHGIAFGKQADTSKSVNLASDWNLQKNGTNVDLIVERGSWNGWYWRKYDSGLYEADGRFTVTVTTSTATGEGFFSEVLTEYLPFATYNTIITGTSNAVTFVCNTTATDGNDYLNFRLARFISLVSSGSSGSYDVNLHVTGRWKTFVPS